MDGWKLDSLHLARGCGVFAHINDVLVSADTCLKLELAEIVTVHFQI